MEASLRGAFLPATSHTGSVVRSGCAAGRGWAAGWETAPVADADADADADAVPDGDALSCLDAGRLRRLLLVEELAQFLYHEADLLDDGRYQDWLDLLTEDLIYTMPLRINVPMTDVAARSQTQAGQDVCWFDEGKDTLRKRVSQLQTGLHWAEEPLSRVSHLVTNVRLRHPESTGSERVAEVGLSCRFVVYRNRVADETDFFVGRRFDTVRATEQGWKLCRRELQLNQNVLQAKNLTLLF